MVVLTALALSSACLRRDVSAEEPTTKISFETVVPQPAIDKVDLLEPAKAAPKPITNAPAPPSKTVSGGASAGEIDTAKGVSTRQHIEAEEREIAERRKRGHRY